MSGGAFRTAIAFAVALVATAGTATGGVREANPETSLERGTFEEAKPRPRGVETIIRSSEGVGTHGCVPTASTLVPDHCAARPGATDVTPIRVRFSLTPNGDVRGAEIIEGVSDDACNQAALDHVRNMLCTPDLDSNGDGQWTDGVELSIYWLFDE